MSENNPLRPASLCPYCEWPLSRERIGGPYFCKICKSEFDFSNSNSLNSQAISPQIQRVQEILSEGELGTLALVDVNELQIPQWKQIVTLFGFPVEESDIAITKIPVGAFILLFFCIVLYFVDTETQLHFALDGDNPFRYFGLNFFSYSLVHSDFLHLAFNLLFVSPFIDATNEDLGTLNFFKLVAASAIFAGVSQHLFEASAYTLVGASGVFLGIATYYCLRFPQSRFLITLPFVGLIAYTKRLRVRAWLLILGYLVLELVDLRSQLTGKTTTSHLGHLGGILAGALCYYLNTKREKLHEK